MAEVTLAAEVGRVTGSAAARRLRGAGAVPGIVYGHGMKPLPVAVNGRELRTVLSVHGLNQVLTLEIGGHKHLVLARELQRHPVRHTLAHVDFQVVRRDEVVHAEVPIVLVGEATKVERERGILEHLLNALPVRTTPANIPSEITLDVSALDIGDSLRVRDLVLPSGVTTDLDPDEAVVLAAPSPVSAQIAAAEAAEAAAEAGPAAGAEAAPSGTAGAGSQAPAGKTRPAGEEG